MNLDRASVTIIDQKGIVKHYKDNQVNETHDFLTDHEGILKEILNEYNIPFETREEIKNRTTLLEKITNKYKGFSFLIKEKEEKPYYYGGYLAYQLNKKGYVVCLNVESIVNRILIFMPDRLTSNQIKELSNHNKYIDKYDTSDVYKYNSEKDIFNGKYIKISGQEYFKGPDIDDDEIVRGGR